MQILVVEDERKIAAFLKRGLESEGFTVTIANDGQEALEIATSSELDLVILDLVLPRMSGEEVLAALRGQGFALPVIVLTAKDAVSDRVANLDAGADDYLTKPFSFSELLARIRARLRSTDGASAGTASANLIEQGDLVLDLRSREAQLGDSLVDLTNREFAVLETFMRHPGQVLSQTQLLDQVWGYDFDPQSNICEVYVGYLRKKLRPEMIETVRGAGYRFRP